LDFKWILKIELTEGMTFGLLGWR